MLYGKVRQDHRPFGGVKPEAAERVKVNINMERRSFLNLQDVCLGFISRNPDTDNTITSNSDNQCKSEITGM